MLGKIKDWCLVVKLLVAIFKDFVLAVIDDAGWIARHEDMSQYYNDKQDYIKWFTTPLFSMYFDKRINKTLKKFGIDYRI